MHKKLYWSIKKDNNVYLVNEQVDIFFHGNVLKRYLTLPLWLDRDVLVQVYENFKKHFTKDCIYKIANIQRHGRAFFANIFFKMNNEHKYILSMLFSDNHDIDHQKLLLNTIISENYPVEISDVSIPNENLPEPIDGIIKDLTSRKINPDLLHLRKITQKNDLGQTISFHDMHLLTNRDNRNGITVLAGFQY